MPTLLMSSLLLLGPAPAWPSPAPELPAGRLQVPIVVQATAYSCGAAALLAVLRYWKAFDGEEMELHGPLGTSPDDGTHLQDIKDVAASHGLSARVEVDMTLESLLKALEKGETAIMDLQARRRRGAGGWEDVWQNGHYVVLVGKDSRFIYVMDPWLEGSYGYIPREELESRWHDFEKQPDGSRREYRHAAVLVSGKEHIPAFPALERVP